MLKDIKSWLVDIFLFTALGFAVWSYAHIAHEVIEPNLTEELRQKVDTAYIESHITTALNQKNFDDIKMYQNLAKMLDITLSKRTLQSIAEENSLGKKMWRNIKAFGSGFLSGKSDSAVGLGGSIASDMTLYGDLRDIKREGSKYRNGEDYDAFVLKISLIGVGLSATQLLSVGATTPLKVGASVMKVAKKSGKLTKPFTKIIATRLSKTIDPKILKTLDAKAIAKNMNLAPVKGLFKEINGIKKQTSTVDTLALLKYVNNTNDLRKIGKLSKTYKTNTKGVMKVLGKRALRAGKMVIKYTSKFIVGIIGLFIGLFGFLFLTVL